MSGGPEINLFTSMYGTRRRKKKRRRFGRWLGIALGIGLEFVPMGDTARRTTEAVLRARRMRRSNSAADLENASRFRKEWEPEYTFPPESFTDIVTKTHKAKDAE